MISTFITSPINAGHYNVIIDLDSFGVDLHLFKTNIQYICSYNHDFADLCELDDHILKYQSESLFPTIDDAKKQKILIILGNPATHSVAKGMFFFSRENGEKHQFWGRLEKAGLLPRISNNDRTIEAAKRKELILSGKTSNYFLLGLTTFYSLPTPVTGKFRDSKGVELLFSSSLAILQNYELKRIREYPFSHNAMWIFTQKSSYNYANNCGINNAYYWPLRGQGSGGSDLHSMLPS